MRSSGAVAGTPAGSPSGSRRALALTLAGVCVAAGLLAPAAGAHGERDPALRTIVDAVPKVPGLEVRVAPGVAQRLEVRNRSAATLEVLAATGEAFLRIGRSGVQADVASRAWYASGNADGVVRVPRGVRLGGPARWRTVTRQPRWGWFAHELHPNASGGVPPAVSRAARSARLGHWKVAVRLDGRRQEVKGHFEYRPVRGNLTVSLTTPAEVAPGVTVAVLQGRVPGLFLASTSRRVVVVTGADGRPFARMSPAGTELNVAGETYRQQPGAPAGTPALGGRGARGDRWRRVTKRPTLSWIEPRAAYPRDEPDPGVLTRTEPTVLKRWSVGLRVGARDTAIGGTTSWVPLPAATERAPAAARPEGVGVLPFALAGAVALVLLLGGALTLRRRSTRAGPTPG